MKIEHEQGRFGGSIERTQILEKMARKDGNIGPNPVFLGS
jgi:hypothetical protein